MLTAGALAVIARNRGLISREEARDAGLSAGDIKQLVRTGRLVILRRGMYVDGALWRSLDPRHEQHRLRTRAAVAKMRRGFVISHDSAAHEQCLDILLPPEPVVHITRPGSTAAWTRHGIAHHLARFRESQVERIDELPVFDIARTAVDIARHLGTPYGEVACDAALRRGVQRSSLEAACEPMENWPYVQRVRSAVAFARAGTESLAETLGRLLVAELAVGEVDLQFPVRLSDGRVVWGDLRVGCHIFEVDGRLKYQAPRDGGVALDPPHEVVWAEKKRDRLLFHEGLGTSHIVWQDFWSPHRAEAIKRLRSEHADTVARFGPALPERLLRQARELRGRRGA